MVGRLEYRKRDDHNGDMRTGSDIALASAYGDALGAPYEFIPVVMPPDPVVMTSNGTWARGEWTDDTAMSVPILEASALGLDLSSPEAQGYIFRRWMDWALVTKDIGNQTSRVIRNVRARILPAHDDARVADTARYTPPRSTSAPAPRGTALSCARTPSPSPCVIEPTRRSPR